MRPHSSLTMAQTHMTLLQSRAHHPGATESSGSATPTRTPFQLSYCSTVQCLRSGHQITSKIPCCALSFNIDVAQKHASNPSLHPLMQASCCEPDSADQRHCYASAVQAYRKNLEASYALHCQLSCCRVLVLELYEQFLLLPALAEYIMASFIVSSRRASNLMLPCTTNYNPRLSPYVFASTRAIACCTGPLKML